jgi:hypothetical protein
MFVGSGKLYYDERNDTTCNDCVNEYAFDLTEEEHFNLAKQGGV